jgi:hypothetical protein
MTGQKPTDENNGRPYLALQKSAPNARAIWQLSNQVMNDLGMSDDAIRAYLHRNGQVDDMIDVSHQ